jgi:O-antigen/teichoic acid export membrane protein
MSRSQRFAGGVGFGYLNQAAATLLALGITPFVFHRIGKADYGIWLVAVQIMVYLNLMDLGVIGLLPREIAYATGRAGGREHTTELPALIGRTMRIAFLQTVLIALTGLALWLTLRQGWAPLSRVAGFLLISFTVLFPLRVFAAVLEGLQDLWFVGMAQLCGTLLSALVSVTLVVWGFGLFALAAAWTTGQMVLALFCWGRIRLRFPGILPPRLPRLDRASVRRTLGSGLWLTISQVAQALLNGTDLLIIARILGPGAVVPYAFTGKLIAVMANQPQLLMQSAGPALSEMRTGESTDRQVQACNALSQASLLASGAIACLLMVTNRGFVSWWIGPSQYAGSLVCALLLIKMVLRHWNGSVAYTLFCLGGERRLALTTLLDGVVAGILAILLVPRFGLIGAPVALIAGVALISLPANLAKVGESTGRPALELVKPLAPWFRRFIPLALAAFALASLWTPSDPLRLIAASIAVASLYGIVMLPVAFAPPLGVYIRNLLALTHGRLSGAFASLQARYASRT